MLTETAGDVAIAAAICSSFLEFPIPNNIAFIGEIGLGGELRAVPRMEKRVHTVAKLGYKMCVIPKSAEKSLANLGLTTDFTGFTTSLAWSQNIRRIDSKICTSVLAISVTSPLTNDKALVIRD
ncbi:hypothetical protein D5086_001735 [Populus alba]|uniref:Uncharacterized protein n=1 Tax=Populus alba TaxID=43335 RepID=A0ACC4CZS1_POPAL